MAVRNDLTINWDASPRIIVVDAPSTQISIQDLHDSCRFLESEASAMDNPPLIDTAGKEELGGGVVVGLTATLQNALLAFEARPGPSYVQCSVSGGNVVALDINGDALATPIYPTAFTQIVVTASSSATLQELGAIQYSSFNGGVTVDVTSLNSGIDFPIGTPQAPVNNLIDAMLIATERGFGKIYIIGDATIDNGGDYTSIEFVGESKTKSRLTISAASTVYKCEFIDATITGTLDGECKARNCVVEDINYVSGFIESCVLQGTMSLGGGGTANFLDCWSGIPGASTTPIIDFGGSGTSLALRGYNGGVTFTNKSGPEEVSVDMASGQIRIENTVTNGAIALRGVGLLTQNDSGGTSTILDTLLNPVSISDTVWDTTVSTPTTGTYGYLLTKVLTVAKFIGLK